MDLRDNKSRLILIVVALGAALVIAVASCGGGGGGDEEGAASGDETTETTPGDDGESGQDEEGEAEEVQPLAEVTGQHSETLTVTRAERETGGFLTIEGTLTNGGSETLFDLFWAGSENELVENGFSMAGATVVAHEEGKRYLILRDTTGRCLCTGFGDGIEPGATVPWYAQFPAPDQGTTQVDFQVADLPPATIEIR
ncbi:hypothetical protein [Streptomyces sp. 8K308]|uniref:hypothetical protein n=1 Tax=Streptomyces sp. 8K308 TaxID=2530388 RepID=UPI001FB715AF|nr:hypothetical protein [Streptomyces sp. 8K308]